MGKSDNVIKFEEALKNSEEKRKAYEEALKKIVDEKSASSDGEAVQKAAKVIGFELSMEEMERAHAEMQEIDDDDLEMASGGGGCWYDHGCILTFKHSKEQHKDEVCLHDYMCAFVFQENEIINSL